MDSAEEAMQTEAPVPETQEVPEAPETSDLQLEPPLEHPLEPPARIPRIRKVRVKPSAPRAVSPPPANVFWADRLNTHRAEDRMAKEERYGNLRIA